MSNVHDDLDNEAQEPAEKNPVRARMRELESEVKALREKAAEAEKLQRELAFSKAGIPMDSPMSKYFVKGYDGEMTAQAVRQAAIEAGFLQTAADASVPREVAQAQDRVVNAAIGGAYENDGESAALARMEQAMQEGGIDAMLDVARQFGIPIGTEM